MLPQVWHCAVCATKVLRTSSSDPRAECLTCGEGHRCVLATWSPLASATATASVTAWPELQGADAAASARFWLSDTAAREVLNDDLATILRVYLDGPARDAVALNRCPMCGLDLSEVHDPADAWVRTTACIEKHLWAVRGRRISSRMDHQSVSFIFEPSAECLQTLARAWLEPVAAIQSNVHPSVRLVLEAIAESSEPIKGS